MDPILSQHQDILAPTIESLAAMLATAQDAFIRHSRKNREELLVMREEACGVIQGATRRNEAALAGKDEAEKADLLLVISILSHLEIMCANMAGLAEPIQRKIQTGVLFTDKAYMQMNYLFQHIRGILGTLLEIIKTDNDFLKKYVLEEGRILVQLCLDVGTEHETRMIEGLCMPQASPIFLSMLDRFRLILRHVLQITKLLSKEP